MVVNGVGAMDVSVKRSAAEFCANVIARSDDRAMTIAFPRSSHSVIVARSTLRAITFVSARCASLQLTSIAPTHVAIASVAMSSHGRR
jgi:hypothetical protein